ncbi:MAG: FimB/Mfa2 family fimbrial subunit [Spirosomaceae bacterium]|nr:FimB/Mfa2 family fimbrial subunit [Spirosomataceae bacterium]MDP5140109.1 FimB/Mfa2 family fimbrial subunit [Spirosomataceae bacterium]
MKKLFKTLAVVLIASATTFASATDDKMAIKEIDTFAVGMYKLKNTSKVRLMLDKFQTSTILVQLADENGNLLHREFISKKQMDYSKTFDLSKLADGTYTFTIENGIKKETHNVVISTNLPEIQTYRKLTVN